MFWYRNIHITWIDGLNSTLMFDHTVYYGDVTENSSRVMVVAVVNVIDSYLNEHIMFSLLNPNPGFQIGLTSGVISSTGIPFNRENKDCYLLIVQVSNIIREKAYDLSVDTNGKTYNLCSTIMPF